ncbi:arginine repressor [Howardella ureilytica]|nr:arginine repressor [Lachnospiraceae bacterium]MDY2956237.1 arginine repressor [Lachnospiraceae bacterium]
MKSERQNKIIELIRKNNIETQEELADALNLAGYNVTQATVSRDIRELNLTKTSIDGKHQKYVIYQSADINLADKYVNVMRDGFISMSVAQNLLIIKTVPGMAGAVCAALDAMDLEEVVGSVAGDDTIMAATSSKEDATALKERLHIVLKSREDINVN